MIWIFWEMTSGIIHVFSTLWFDSGYMSMSGHEAFGIISYVLHVKWTLGDDFKIVSVFSAELGSTADTCTASVYGAFEEAPFFSSWCL